MIFFFFLPCLLSTQWCIIAVSLVDAHRAGLCMFVCVSVVRALEWHGGGVMGEIWLSGSIIVAIKPCCCSAAHNQSGGGKLTAE